MLIITTLITLSPSPLLSSPHCVLLQELPVVRMEQEVMETIHNNDIVILCGETGSGKTTQVR